METLRKLLTESGRDPGEAEEIASRYGYDPATLTEADAALIAQEELQSVALAKSNGNGKAAKSKNKSTRRKKTPDLTEALAHTAAIANQELSAVHQIVKAGADAWAEDQADQMISTVRNAPKEALQKLGQMALDEAADLDSFRAIANQISATLFSVPSATEAE